MRIEIVVLTVFLGNWVILNVEPYSLEYMDSTLTLVFIGVVAFFVSQCFVSIYAEAADALIVCFLVDKENGPVTDSCPWELVEYLQEIKENNDVIE